MKRILVKRLLVSLSVIAVVFLASGVQATYLETFDTGKADWNYGYGTGFTLGSVTWASTGGNPGGFISGAANNLYAVWTYNTSAYGDLTGLILTIDTKIVDDASGNAQFYVGRGGTYFIDSSWSISGDTGWTTHSTMLDSAHFTPWTGVNNNIYTLAQVLQAPDDIGIFFGGIVAGGTGSLQVDNFGSVSAPVPEPATMLLLGSGLVGLAGFGRKKLFKK